MPRARTTPAPDAPVRATLHSVAGPEGTPLGRWLASDSWLGELRPLVGPIRRPVVRVSAPEALLVLLSAEEEGLRLVATDSYRLAMRDLPGTSVLETGQQVLVPAAATNSLSREYQYAISSEMDW